MSDYTNSDDDQADLPQDEDLLQLLHGTGGRGGSSFLSSVGALADPDDPSRKKRKRQVREQEAEFEKKSRRGQVDPDAERGNVVKRLPIKLASGQLQQREGETVLPVQVGGRGNRKGDSSDDDSDAEPDEEWAAPRYQPEGAGLGTRWGRMAVADVVRIKNPAERRQVAKEQIAGLGAEIVAGGELVDNLPLLSRLSAFGFATVPNPDPAAPKINNPVSVRALAIMSLLAVFKDVIPGYRIRELTAAEEAEKVREEVRRMRDGEAGLVRSYAGFLKMLEREVKAKSQLAGLGLRCMCELLTAVPHFNFRDNIMAVIVGRLSRRSWDAESDTCLQAITTIFQTDMTSTHSLPLVRLLNRMIKERHFNVHPNVLSCLWHVKVRAAPNKESSAPHKRRWDKDRDWKKKAERGKGVNKERTAYEQGGEWAEKKREWRTKKLRKELKEKKAIEKEMDEAGAEVDEEEANRNQTETLQHLFVLYFSILKQTKRTPLLPAALEGLARFAHLVNVDFFRDLLGVLRSIVKGDRLDELVDNEDSEDETVDAQGWGAGRGAEDKTRLRLLAIVTAFELLSGQGEALNIDLSDFITDLYGVLPHLSFDPRFEEVPLSTTTLTALSASGARVLHKKSQLSPSADLLFRALQLVFFSPYASHASSPPWRSAAFAKRLLTSALLFPPKSALRSLDFVKQLLVREPKVEALLCSDDRTADGVYRGDVDDPQVANPFAGSFYELGLLEGSHWDERVRAEAGRLTRYTGQ